MVQRFLASREVGKRSRQTTVRSVRTQNNTVLRTARGLCLCNHRLRALGTDDLPHENAFVRTTGAENLRAIAVEADIRDV